MLDLSSKVLADILTKNITAKWGMFLKYNLGIDIAKTFACGTIQMYILKKWISSFSKVHYFKLNKMKG